MIQERWPYGWNAWRPFWPHPTSCVTHRAASISSLENEGGAECKYAGDTARARRGDVSFLSFLCLGPKCLILEHGFTFFGWRAAFARSQQSGDTGDSQAEEDKQN